MNWLRINRYWEEVDTKDAHDRPQYDIQFVPMLCQHCGHAPCESVCPVLATYHNVDGLNAMIYNRCVGTRYCANNCPYVVRRFNFHSYKWPEPFNLQLNPDVNVRTMGVMEKCTFCIQKTRNVKIVYREKSEDGFTGVVPDEVLHKLPACANACPSESIIFGNRNDPESKINKLGKSTRAYEIMPELNTKTAIRYLAKASPHKAAPHGGHGGHGGGHGDDHGGSHGDTHGKGHGDDHSGGHGHGHDTEKHHEKPSDGHHEGGH